MLEHMKKTKIVLITLALLIVIGGAGTFTHFKNKFLSAPPNELTLSETGEPFEFFWYGQEIDGEYEPHYAMFVPVTIPGVEHTFYMQFDTGAHSTVLDYKAVQSINEKFGPVFQVSREGDAAIVSDVELNVGTVSLQGGKMYFRSMGTEIDWSNPPQVIKIGTVGADFMERHVLEIDYANQQITLGDSAATEKIAENDFSPLTFEGRKVFLAAKLNDGNVSLWFDSGSSAFEMIVDENTFELLASPDASRKTYTGSTWGTGITVHNQDATGEFRFGTTSVPLTYVTYIEWPNKLQTWIMKASNVGGDLGGMTGNKLFLGKKLVLDTPNLRYALVP